jgi:hypothetical protein
MSGNESMPSFLAEQATAMLSHTNDKARTFTYRITTLVLALRGVSLRWSLHNRTLELRRSDRPVPFNLFVQVAFKLVQTAAREYSKPCFSKASAPQSAKFLFGTEPVAVLVL